MKKILIILIIAAVYSVSAGAQSWKTYPYQAPGSQIQFPKDEGGHSGFPNLEWWYAVMHLKGKNSGDQYSVLVTHFNNGLRFFTVTNLTQQKHTSGATFGFLSSPKGNLDLIHKTKYGSDHFKSVGAFDYMIQTHYEDMDLNVALSATKKPLMVGGDGYGPVGNSGNTFYYSLTRLQVDGELNYLGITEPVQGEAWMDHQWGPFIVSPFPVKGVFETYEWFCLQLDNGQELMISNIFDRKNNLPAGEAYGGVQVSLQNGESVHTLNRKFNRTRFWLDPVSKTYMSMGWILDLPEQDIHLELTPEYLDQMVSLPFHGSFWEGSIKVRGTVAGKSVRGKAFGELIHRYELPELQISGVKPVWTAGETLNLQWTVQNPDAGNPLHYQVYLKTNDREVLLRSNLVKSEVQIPAAEVIALSQKNEVPLKVQLIVKAQSVDGVIEGRELSSKFVVYTVPSNQ